MDKLNPVKNDLGLKRMWCGPTVVAGLTGQPMSKVIAAFREIMPEVKSAEGVRGTTNYQVSRVLEKFGYRLERRDTFSNTNLPPGKYGAADNYGRYHYRDASSRPTLAQYASKNRAKFQKHAMLVNVTGHWTSLYGRRGLDNHCPEYKPVPLRKLNFRRSRVYMTWNVIPIGEVRQPDPVLTAPPKPPKSPFVKTRAAAAGANAVANQIAAAVNYTNFNPERK